MPGRFPPPARWSLLTVLVVIATESAAVADSPTCPAGATDRAAIVCEINAARGDAGRAALTRRRPLAEAARAHSSDMVGRGYFEHESPEGEGPAERARRAGYMRRAESWRIGEVLLWSRGEPLTAARAVELWLESPNHRHILLSPHYRDLGVGLVAGAPSGDPDVQPATTVTVVFGRRSR